MARQEVARGRNSSATRMPQCVLLLKDCANLPARFPVFEAIFLFFYVENRIEPRIAENISYVIVYIYYFELGTARRQAFLCFQ